jgi:hypothetical protein
MSVSAAARIPAPDRAPARADLARIGRVVGRTTLERMSSSRHAQPSAAAAEAASLGFAQPREIDIRR